MDRVGIDSKVHVVYLVGGLLNLLRIERSTDTKSDTGAEEDVVGESGDTTVVDFALLF